MKLASLDKLEGGIRKFEPYLLLPSIILPFCLSWALISGRAMPLWSDPGEWLKYANAVEASIGLERHSSFSKLYPMWDQNVWQYPPLFFLFLSLARRFLGSLQALKFLASLLLALQPIPTYLIAKIGTGSILAGLIAAYTASFMPIYEEMYGWGGYPNLLGFIILGLTYYAIVKTMRASSPKNYLTLILLSSLLPISHHLTYGIFLGTTITWLVLLVVFNRSFEWKPIALALTISLTVFLAYRLLLAYPSQYVTFNEAAYYSLRFDPFKTIPWIFKGLLPVVAVALTIMVFFGLKGLTSSIYKLLLSSWTLFPSIATLGFLVGVAVDYNRIFFFALQPIPMIVASPIAGVLKSNPKLEPALPFKHRFLTKLVSLIPQPKRVGLLLLVVLPLLSMFSVSLYGFTTMFNVVSWYGNVDPYGDVEKIAALDWITRNTRPSDVFVADELMGRWIEGYAQRRVYMYQEPRFMFIVGQLERYYVASAVLEAVYEIRNRYLRVLDQNPYNPGYAPIIEFWYQGEYKKALIVDDSLLQLSLRLNHNLLKLSLKNSTNILSALSSSEEGRPVIRTTYQLESLTISKEVSILSRPAVIISYSIETQDPNLEVGCINITARIAYDRKVSLLEVEGDKASAHTDIGVIEIRWSSPAEAVGTPLNDKLTVIFKPDSYPRFLFQMLITLETGYENEHMNGVVAVDVKRMIVEKNISYMVIPRVECEGLTSYPEFQHLLNAHRTVYTNRKVIILDVRKLKQATR